MRRREFLPLLGGAAAFWRLGAARAQTRRAWRLLAITPQAPERDYAARVAAFESGLRALGWTPDSDIRIDYRVVDLDQEIGPGVRAALAAAPEIVLAQSTRVTREVLQATRSIPVVFIHVSDPLGSGFVGSLGRPGGNATGFIDVDAAMGGKWLQLLKEIAPRVNRALLLFNPDTAPRRGELFLGSFADTGRTLGVSTSPAPVRDWYEIKKTLATLGALPGGGVAASADSFTNLHVDDIITFAGRFGLPVVCDARRGGLVSYDTDSPELFRRAAGYVDRILRGASPADLPVQPPTKFTLAINTKTAAALGLSVPPALLARADEVIE